MYITYERPTHLDDEQTDPQAPAADMAPGADVDPRVPVCGATTYDVDGTRWTCTRPLQHTDDEHRAVFEPLSPVAPSDRSRSRGSTSGAAPGTARRRPSP
ncbi:hypothetical protein QP157_21230 [Sphingomonas sp. LR61]|uniref:hypothetical protein n=1 Tax=Sphingomonas sp. LR61 TaxID=3050234 RepID=UPI002FE173B8